MLKTPGGFERFITNLSCDSPAITLHTSTLNYSPFSILLHKTKLHVYKNVHPLGLSTSNNTVTIASFQSVINWPVICFVEVLTVTAQL